LTLQIEVNLIDFINDGDTQCDLPESDALDDGHLSHSRVLLQPHQGVLLHLLVQLALSRCEFDVPNLLDVLRLQVGLTSHVAWEAGDERTRLTLTQDLDAGEVVLLRTSPVRDPAPERAVDDVRPPPPGDRPHAVELVTRRRTRERQLPRRLQQLQLAEADGLAVLHRVNLIEDHHVRLDLGPVLGPEILTTQDVDARLVVRQHLPGSLALLGAVDAPLVQEDPLSGERPLPVDPHRQRTDHHDSLHAEPRRHLDGSQGLTLCYLGGDESSLGWLLHDPQDVSLLFLRGNDRLHVALRSRA